MPADSKVVGNGLREVDRFLSLLIDAVAVALCLTAPDRAALARLHNTARKLTSLRARMALPTPDEAGLRAIGRSRACLFHTAGIVRHTGPRSGPTAGWAHPDTDRPDAPIAIGSPLAVSIADLRRVALFYDRIAIDLVTALQIKSRSIDILAPPCYIKTAHVACDGI